MAKSKPAEVQTDRKPSKYALAQYAEAVAYGLPTKIIESQTGISAKLAAHIETLENSNDQERAFSDMMDEARSGGDFALEIQIHRWMRAGIDAGDKLAIQMSLAYLHGRGKARELAYPNSQNTPQTLTNIVGTMQIAQSADNDLAALTRSLNALQGPQ
jgi:hypothetical protein